MIRKHAKTTIKEYFFNNPTTQLRVRQIERATKISLPSVIRYTKELEKENILKRSEIANIITYSADRMSKKFLTEKKCFNIQQLSALTDFLIEQYSNPTIRVFGSYAKGEDVEKSDIDVYVETQSSKIINLKKFEMKLGRTIQLFVFKHIQNVKNKNLANNIVNGIVLNGFMEVFK